MKRIKAGDRVRHLNGNEGTVISITATDDATLINVAMDTGSQEVGPAGYWEKIPGERLSA